MHIVGEFRFDYPLVRRMTLDAFGRKRLIVMRVAGLIILPLALLMIARRGLADQLWGIAGGTFLLVMPEVLAALTWWTQRSLFAHPVRYEITDAGIRIVTVSSDTTLTWSGLAWVRRHRDVWLVKHGAVQNAIPRGAFTPAEQAAIDARVTA